MNTQEQQLIKKEYVPNQDFSWQQGLCERIRPDTLPVMENRDSLYEMISASLDDDTGIVLVQGETGSGKSVLLPGILRNALKAKNLPLKTLVVEPRRDAAYRVSRSIAAVENLTWGQGGIVGCSTSEAKHVDAHSEIPVVTTGIALRYLSEELRKSSAEGTEYRPTFGAIVVDEFHENSIEYHLILGILKTLQERGSAPFILLTSATLDKEKIQQYFDIPDKKYQKVDGRTYPVECFFAEEKEVVYYGSQRKDNYIQDAIQETKAVLNETGEGDILVFMPGIREIRATMEGLEGMQGIEVLALHGKQDENERGIVLSSDPVPGIRRVIVATNIAETSLTIPRIVAVVDSCRHKAVTFNAKKDIYETQVELISQSSAQQRAGRAGRVRPGVCRRLVTEKEWQDMPEYSVPEIERANLAHVVLTLRGLDIDPEEFPFIDPPEPNTLHMAVKELELLGALTAEGEVTPVGRRMLDMPFFKPSTARMVVESESLGCVESTLVLATLERESALFPMLQGSEIQEEQKRILETRGYTVVRMQPMALSYYGQPVDEQRVDRIHRDTLKSARVS